MNSIGLFQVSPVTLGPPGPKCPEGRCPVRNNLGPQSAARSLLLLLLNVLGSFLPQDLCTCSALAINNSQIFKNSFLALHHMGS